MSELPADHTPCTAQQLVDALVSIWPSELGGTPSLETVCVLTSQWALETKHGVSMIQNNIGNFKRPNPAAGDWCQFSTFEWIKGVKTMIHPPDIGCRFAAYASLEDGVRSWLRDLYTRWTLAWPGACEGDPDAFAAGLGAQRPPYYTAPVADYQAGMHGYFDLYVKTLTVPALPDPLAETDPFPPPLV